MTTHRAATFIVTVSAAALLAGCSSSSGGGTGEVLDLDSTSCSDWTTATAATKDLNAESLVLVLRRAAKSDPEEPTDEQIDAMVDDIDAGCATDPGSTAGAAGSAAALNRSGFYLG